MSTVGKVIALIVTASMLSGCGMFMLSKKLECADYKAPELSVPAIQKLDLQNVRWTVVTPENATQVFEDLKKRGVDAALFALTDEGYVALSTNMEKVQGQLHQQRLVIIEYQTYQKRVDEAVKATSGTKDKK